MSLIIAKKEQQRIYLIADTKLTDSDILPNETRPDRAQMVSDPRDGVIKITLIAPQVAIAFAGASGFADEAIKACRHLRPEQIIKTLAEINKTSGDKVEFIVALNRPQNQLVVIKKGTISTNQETCWIGSPDGFNYYQERLFAQKETDKEHIHDNLYYSQRALKYVIESGLILDVNGFEITVTNELGFFAYKESISIEILPMTISGTGPIGVVIGHGSPQAGGYSVNICPASSHPDILPVHILQGRVGIIYQSRDKGLLYPEILADTDDIEFSEILQKRFGIPIRYRISSPIKSYFDRGVKALRIGDNATAIALFSKGLSEPETGLRPLLNINMARAFYHLGDFAQALQYATEAVRLDPKQYMNWQKIISAERSKPK